MLHKDSDPDWENSTDEQQLVFHTLKTILTSPPILALPKANCPINIDTDDRKYAMGAVLLQQQEDTNPTQWATLG